MIERKYQVRPLSNLLPAEAQLEFLGVAHSVTGGMLLTIFGKGGRPIADFAPGSWASVLVVDIPEEEEE
jgi:hypothetical protein